MRLSFAPLSLAPVRCNAVLRLFFGFSDVFREDHTTMVYRTVLWSD